jgi:hypothetical protein
VGVQRSASGAPERNFRPQLGLEPTYLEFLNVEAVAVSSRCASKLSSSKLLPEHNHHKLRLGLTLGLLGFALACGSSGTPIPITGGFGNSSLKGNYTYHLYGIDTNGEYAEAGVFVADGNGNITSGTDDFNQIANNAGFASNAITGKYSIGRDGNGQITFSFPNISTSTFTVAITLVSTSKLYMTEVDSFANAFGEANLQDTTALGAAPSGTFAFRIHDNAGAGSAGLVGALTSTGGSITGTLDELRGGTLQTGVTVTSGSFSAPDNTGRGTLTIADSIPITSTYVYYIVNASTVELLQQDVNNLALGRMEKQSGGSVSLSGNYVFGSQGDTTSNVLGVHSVGGFTADGTSAITSGAYDSVQDGNQIINQPFTGSFTSTPNGRFAVTFNPSGGSPITEVFWMVSSARAFFLVADSAKVEDGTIDAQQTTSFTNSSLSGQYAYLNGGFDFTPERLTRVGTFIPNGSGNVNLNEVVNAFNPTTGAVLNNPVVPGTYSVATSGRATATLTGATNNIDLVLYMISPGQAYVLQNDSGVEISGETTLQVAP